MILDAIAKNILVRNTKIFMISVRFYYPSRKLGRASLKFRCLRLLRYLNNKHLDAEFSTNIHPSDILVISSVYSNQLVSEISSLKN